MAKMRTISLLAVLGLAWGTANADTLDMRGASAPGSAGPARGTTQSVVEAKFGAPASVKAPVGDPPITRWEVRQLRRVFRIRQGDPLRSQEISFSGDGVTTPSPGKIPRGRSYCSVPFFVGAVL